MNNITKEHYKWNQDNGDNTLRINYLLNKNSVVFDVGGYKGEWSKKIYDMYNCNIYIFEPVKKFYNIINETFKNNNNIKIFNFGLGYKNETINIFLNDDSSSIFLEGKNTEIINIVSIIDFIEENNIKNVDLIKINIEGCEYELLESIINNNKICIFNNIQVQFHSFVEKANEKLKNIRNMLEKTHNLTYCYDFIWENWKKII